MKKAIVLILVLAITLSLCACGSIHKIRITSGENLVDECPKSAKAGETVTVRTLSITDGWIDFSCSEDVERIDETMYQFIMPDHDVTIRISAHSNGLA